MDPKKKQQIPTLQGVYEPDVDVVTPEPIGEMFRDEARAIGGTERARAASSALGITTGELINEIVAQATAEAEKPLTSSEWELLGDVCMSMAEECLAASLHPITDASRRSSWRKFSRLADKCFLRGERLRAGRVLP